MKHTDIQHIKNKYTRINLDFYKILFFAAVVFFISCGGKTPEEELLAPGAVTLTSPTNNNACYKGSTLSGKSTSSVTFTWNTAENAESYQIEITNLNTNSSTTHTINRPSYTISLNSNTYYSWNVKAVNTIGTTSSKVWKFYLSGTPQTSYAPAPADLVTPSSGAVISAKGATTIAVTFQWIGSDLDNDIDSYDFYLDNSNASTKVLSSVKDVTAIQTLTSGKTYCWKIITKDKAGNSSTSEVGSFQIN